MKIDPSDVARALIETCRSLPESEHASIADAALEILRRAGLTGAIRSFPRLVADCIAREDGIVSAALTVPSKPDSVLGIIAVLEQALGKKVHLNVIEDPSLIGGALLSVGDERFDASLHGALQKLTLSLSAAQVA